MSRIYTMEELKRLKKQRRLSEKETEILELWKEEVCSSGDLPEVEIISLLEEQIPKYKLRADTLTQFTGYENQDWFIPSPALKPGEVDTSVLSPDQIRETLNYFLLCSNRVSQMTKTYNDIEAVTRLLEEKEKDVELTARIGKELLSNNQKLEITVSTLESELKSANEKITQLNHELVKKTELIQILTNDVDDSGSEAGTPTGAINFDILQHRIGKLEEENVALRNEASLLVAQTDEVEEKEQKLVTDFAFQLSTLRTDLSSITDEADKYREESLVYKQLSQNLTDKLTSTDAKLNKLKTENEELSTRLVITCETQNELAIELGDLKEKYSEVLGLLQETQELLKKQKKKGLPTAHGGGIYPSLHQSSFSSSNNHDSLGTELECSLFSELSLDSGISTDRVPHFKKVFDTVRTASRSTSGGGSNGSNISPSGSMVNRQTSFDSTIYGKLMHTTSSQRNSWCTVDDFPLSDSECSDDSAYPGGPRVGIPGAPGSADLAEAIRRLTPASVYARRAALSSGMFTQPYPDSECRTPDSIMSTGSFAGGFTSMPWKLPDKLQIVKPLEGSQTLHHWSQLATPSLGGLLDERPGIKTRGGINLEDLGLRMYSLTDVEEDEEVIHPGKSFQPSGTVYTFTNSTVLHPDDGTSLTTSICGSRMSTVSNSRASTAPQTPLRSRRNSTCTFSVTLGLAKLLNERGITAATPSTLVTPSFTPTATPCNSPERVRSPLSSPDHSRSVSPSVIAPFSNAFAFPSYLVSSGAEYLRKTLTGSILEEPGRKSRSRTIRTPNSNPVTTSANTIHQSDKKALTGIRLVETVEKLGVQTLISTTFARSNLTSSNLYSQSMLDRLEEENVTNFSEIGTPGRPGTGVLQQRLNQLPPSSIRSRNRDNARVRPDLGTVLGSVPTTKENPTSSSQFSSGTSTLGTLSSMLFGRKGGLL